MNRTKYALKNAGFGIVGKVVFLILSFVTRTIFIYTLGNTYLGVNGLYSEILNLLSFAELGLGSAMTFAMYKPVVDGDEARIIQLLGFYKKAYRAIAIVIALLGIGLIPFLPIIVRGADWLSSYELRLYFAIYLFNTVVGYFVTFKYSYLNAQQKNYVVTNIDVIVKTVSSLVQIVVLLLYHNFLFFLLANSFVLLFSRILLSVFLNKKYPIYRKPNLNPLTSGEKKPIYKEVKSLALFKFSDVAVHATDNLLISTLTEMGVVAVGFISNYNLLMNSVLGFVTIMLNSVTSGFGNLAASSTTNHFKRVFKEICFASFWIYGFCSIAFWVLIPPFISLWIGPDKLIDSLSFSLIVLNCYFMGQSTAYNNVRIAKGNFSIDKWVGVIQAIVNLFVSIICARLFGLVGIYIGTVVSRMVNVVFRPYITYMFLFKESSKEYYLDQLRFFVFVIVAALITKIISIYLLNEITWIRFIVCVIVVAIVPNLVFLLGNFRSPEFIMWIKRIMEIGKKRTN